MLIFSGTQVIDEDIETGKQFRRFLAYDLLLLLDKDYLKAPFEVRCQLASRECASACSP